MRAKRNALTLLLTALLVLVSLVPPAAAQGPAQGFVYIVRGGEKLEKLALRYGTTVAAIKSRNHLRSNTLWAGQYLVIPASPIPTGADILDPSYNPFEAPPLFVESPLDGIEIQYFLDPKKIKPNEPLRIISLGSLGSTIPSAWKIVNLSSRTVCVVLFMFTMTTSLEGSINRNIVYGREGIIEMARPEWAYPPIPEAVTGIPDSSHVANPALPRHRERITCWRLAIREAVDFPNGRLPCFCGERHNQDGTVSHAFYYCDIPNLPLVTGGKWIANGVLLVINQIPGVPLDSPENLSVFNTSSAFSDPLKQLTQFEPVDCQNPLDLIPRLEEECVS